MCLIKAKGKSKYLPKDKVKSRGCKTEFCWNDDEIQLLLELVNQCKYKCEYEGINWDSVRSKYETIQ